MSNPLVLLLHYQIVSNLNIASLQCIGFNKCPAGHDIVAHKGREDLVGGMKALI